MATINRRIAEDIVRTFKEEAIFIRSIISYRANLGNIQECLSKSVRDKVNALRPETLGLIVHHAPRGDELEEFKYGFREGWYGEPREVLRQIAAAALMYEIIQMANEKELPLSYLLRA